MASPLGPDTLALLLPAVPDGHPLVQRALQVLPKLDGADREAVLAPLLAGPLAHGQPPKEVVAAVIAEARGTMQGRTGEAERLRDVLGRFTDKRVPTELADA